MERKTELGVRSEQSVHRKSAYLRGSLRWVALAVAGSLLAAYAPTVKADGGEFTTDQSRVVGTYFQCGGDAYPDDHVVFVQQFKNPNGFYTADIGSVAGACGVRYIQPDSENRTLASVEYERAHGWPISVGTEDGRIFRYNRTYPQCGGSIGPMDINDDYTVIVDEFREPNTGETTHSWRTVGPQPGQCGNP